MTNTILKVKELSKNYGSLKAVDRLSFTVEQGMVFGILGPNGSGKTSTLGMLTTALKPLSGNFLWFGKEVTADIRRQLGILLEKPNFYDYLSAENNLKIVADIRKLDYKHIEHALKSLGLWERRKSRFKTFSLGMKQRLAIAAAILGDPQVLILDEPTNGLDPEGIAEVRNLIRQMAGQGRTIILASHLLDEVQKVCTDLLVMKSGKKIYEGKIEALSMKNKVLELGAGDNNTLLKELEKWSEIMNVSLEGEFVLAELSETCTPEKVNEYLYRKGIIVNHLITRKANLEEQVLELLRSK